MSIRVIGVDAHPLGWVGIELRGGVFDRAVLASTLYDIVANSPGVAIVGVDVPLGVLPDRCRTADTLAIDQLGPWRGSVFRMPPWPVWQEPDFTAANKVCRELTGVSLSRQSRAIRPKLLEANAIWGRHPGLAHRGPTPRCRFGRWPASRSRTRRRHGPARRCAGNCWPVLAAP